ncbi:hypothetical protein Tco_0747786 [Tanacetum coccineum]|uniref:Uncharacterized protein n=1 Tax=Tanacetum coccineum TaxID=301880 RepID=A0ABQ4YUP0_9ASTR
MSRVDQLHCSLEPDLSRSLNQPSCNPKTELPRTSLYQHPLLFWMSAIPMTPIFLARVCRTHYTKDPCAVEKLTVGRRINLSAVSLRNRARPKVISHGLVAGAPVWDHTVVSGEEVEVLANDVTKGLVLTENTKGHVIIAKWVLSYARAMFELRADVELKDTNRGDFVKKGSGAEINQSSLSRREYGNRDDDILYKFKEGDFHRLRIQDIEDMLLLLIQGKRVEDLQLGVESYQKKLNLTKPDTYRSNLRRKDAYTPYSDPRGFIYENKDRRTD